MNRYIIFGLIILTIIISGCSQEEGVNYIIDGNSVMVDDANIYLKATPHTLKHSDWVEAEFQSKVFSGDIDFAFGFDTNDIKPLKVQRWDPHEETIEGSYTCDYEFGYNATDFWCFIDDANGTTTLFEHNYDRGNIPTKTAYWNTTVQRDWSDWSGAFNSVDYDFDGKNKWYYKQGQSITAGQTYRIRYYLDVPYNTTRSKYDLAIKPSSETIQEAIANDHFYFLDPWTDYDLNTGILAYYSFDDADGNCSDLTGNDYNCTPESNLDSTNRTIGILGECWNITSTNTWLNISKHLDLDTTFTVSLWTKGFQTSTSETYFTLNTDNDWQEDSTSSSFVISGQKITNGGEFDFQIHDGTTLWDGSSDDTKHTDNIETWQLLVAVFDNSTNNITIYVGNQTDMQNWTLTSVTPTLPFNMTGMIGERSSDYGSPGGVIDELGIWNRTLTNSEVIGLWNNGAGLTYESAPPPSDITIDTLQIKPDQAYVATTTLNCSAFIYNDNGYNYNVTINWTNATDYLSQSIIKDKANGTYSSFNLTAHPFKVGEVLNCTMFAHERDNISVNFTSSITREISDTIPIWVDDPTNKTVYNTENITLDYNCTDPDGAETYYISNFTINLQVPLTINEVSGNISHDPTYNDTGQFDFNVTCKQGANNISQVLNITILQGVTYYQNVSKQIIGEGNNQVFYLDITTYNYTKTPEQILLNFNGSSYTGSLYDSDTSTNIDYWNYSVSTTIVNGSGGTGGVVQDYNWSFNMTGVFVEPFETNRSNFTIYGMGFDDCSIFSETILNLTLYDEENNTMIWGDIEVELTLTSWLNSSILWTHNGTWDNKTNATICIPDGLLNESNYMIDVTVEYSSIPRVTEFWFLDYGNLSTLDSLNTYTNKYVGLYDLATADSTSFLMGYLNIDGLTEDNIILITYRKYVGEGLFREVERSREDENGDTVVHLVEEDVIYYFTVTQNGTILFTSQEFTALCQQVPCEFTLQEGEDFVEFDVDWDLVGDGAYSIGTNPVSREITLTFATTTPHNWTLQIYRYSNNASQASLLNSSSLHSTSGTITLGTPQTAGNVTFVARVMKEGDFLQDSFVGFGNKLLSQFKTGGGIVLGALIVMTMVMIAVTEGVALAIFLVIGFVLAGTLQLFEFSWGAFISLFLMVALMVWKLAKGRNS